MLLFPSQAMVRSAITLLSIIAPCAVSAGVYTLPLKKLTLNHTDIILNASYLTNKYGIDGYSMQHPELCKERPQDCEENHHYSSDSQTVIRGGHGVPLTSRASQLVGWLK